MFDDQAHVLKMPHARVRLPEPETLRVLPDQHQVEAELMKLRYFVGLTNEEAAEVLGISPRTAKYYWTHARAWLFNAIKSSAF